MKKVRRKLSGGALDLGKRQNLARKRMFTRLSRRVVRPNMRKLLNTHVGKNKKTNLLNKTPGKTRITKI